MKDPIVIVGMGEMGGVFARGLLKLGHPLIPVTRGMNMPSVAHTVREPLLVLLAVAENDLPAALTALPPSWRNRTGLLQNELLPRDWKAHGLNKPTVVAVWFEKKKGQDVKVLVPSPVYGPNARLLVDALGTLDIPAWRLPNEDDLLFELVRKNLYILTTNIAGLVVGGTVDAMWRGHQDLAREIAAEIMDIQFALCGKTLDRERLLAGMAAGIESDPLHQCMGRSAPARLARALAHADGAAIAAPRLRAIAKKIADDGKH